MATTAYCIISNTGSIGGGLKLTVRQDSWHVFTDPAEVFVGLDGTTTVGIGATTGKLKWKFTGRCQKVGATGFVSLDGAGQTVFEWATSTTISKRLLKITDVYGTNYDVVWVSGFNPIPWTGGINGNDEWYETDVELWQQ